MTQPKRVAILGAGPTGLAVAYQFPKDVHQPVIFEADDRVSGMAASFDFSGLKIGRYYHFHCISDAGFLTTLDKLGLGDRMRRTATRMGYWFGKRLQPWGNPVALLKVKGLSQSAEIRHGLHLGATRLDYVDIIDTINKVKGLKTITLHIPYGLFGSLLRVYALFSGKPPLTESHLKTLSAGDDFKGVDTEKQLGGRQAPFAKAVKESCCDPRYSSIVLRR